MRAHGEGSICLRKDGRWVGRLGVSGRRYSVYGRTRTEAVQKLDRLRRWLIPEPVVVGTTTMTVGQFLEQWIESASTTRRPSTVYHYRGIIRTHLVPVLGRIRLQRLTPLHVVMLMDSLVSRGASRTACLAHDALHAALKDAVARRLVSVDVTKGIARPKRTTREIVLWTLDETKRFIRKAQDSESYYAAALLLTLGLGLRLSELLGLRWDDINLGERTVRIQRGLTFTPRPTLGPPKSQAGLRMLSIPEWVMRSLKRLEDERVNVEIVTTETGGSWCRIPLQRRLDRLCVDADVPRLTIHQLRHQCASLLIAAGADIKQVQYFMGHSRASMTLDVYGHLLMRSDPSLARRLDDLLR
jgi:integrase